MTRPFPDDFDPATVPTYPVMTVTVHRADDLYWVDVDHTPVPLGPDIDPTSARDIAAAGIHHVSTICTHRDWQAVRVKAVDADGATWMMIVGPDDQAADLSDPGIDPTTPRTPVLAAALAAGAVAAIAAIAAIVWFVFIPHTTAPAPSTPAPTPAELPAPAPAGWITHATWGLGHRDATLGALATGSDIWSVGSTDGQTRLERVDPATGHIIAGFPLPSGTVSSLTTTRIDNRPVIGAISDTAITWIDPTQSVAHTLTAPPEMTISASASCVWATGDQSVALATGDGFTPRTLPAASTPIGCHDGDIIAADTLGHIWHVGTSLLTTTPQTLTPPAPGAHLEGIVALHDNVMLAEWSTTASTLIAQWWNLATGHQIATTPHTNPLPVGTPATSEARWTAAASTVIDWHTRRLIEAPDTTTDVIVASHHAWWSTETTSTTIDLATGQRRDTAVAAQPADPQFIIADQLGVIDHTSRNPGLYLLEAR